jgi:beta-glucosidase
LGWPRVSGARSRSGWTSAASNHPFSIWNVASNAWKIVDGKYVVSVGSSSRDLPLQESVKVHK